MNLVRRFLFSSAMTASGSKDMSAVDVDFNDLTHLARGGGGVGEGESKPKRSLERGGSDAKPPVAKAKASVPGPDEQLLTAAAVPVPTTKPPEAAQALSAEAVMELLQQLVQQVQTIGSAVTELKDIKENVQILESNVENMYNDMQDVKKEVAATANKVSQTEKALQELQDQVTALKLAETSWTEKGVDDYNWPKVGEGVQAKAGKGRWDRHLTSGRGEGLGKGSVAYSSASDASVWPGQDQIIVGGFPPNSNKAVREQGAKMVLAALPSSRALFEPPQALFATGRVCHVTKKADAPWSALRRAVEEYRDTQGIEVKIEGKLWKLWVGLNKSPQRRKRNAILRRLERRAMDKGAPEVTIDWWGGHVLSKGLRIVTVTEDGGVRYIPNPWLEALDTEKWMQDEERIFRSRWDWREQV